MPDTEPVHTKRVETTVMFADIAHSTDLFDRLGDESAALVVGQILDTAAAIVASNHGVPLRTQGDDVLSTFTEAEHAASAALAIHAAVRELSSPDTGELSVRVGINSGPAILAHGDILGDTVNVAARLAAFAKAGQTIVSRQTLDALRDSSAESIRPVGEISLKGKSGPVKVFELHDPRDLDEITEVRPIASRMPAFNRLHLRFRSSHHKLDYLLVRYLLGRAPDCDLILDHPLVSRHHAEIRYQNGEFILRDFSTNGTVLISGGDLQSIHHSQAALRGRGSILLGRTGYDRRLAISYHTVGS